MGEFDDGEDAVSEFAVTGVDAAEVVEFAKEALDLMALATEHR